MSLYRCRGRVVEFTLSVFVKYKNQNLKTNKKNNSLKNTIMLIELR